MLCQIWPPALDFVQVPEEPEEIKLKTFFVLFLNGKIQPTNFTGIFLCIIWQNCWRHFPEAEKQLPFLSI